MDEDRLQHFLRHNYMLLFVLLFFFYTLVPTMAPVLMHAGYELPARVIYKIYSFLCHQLPYRSFFLYGEQAYYPLELAGVPGIRSFEDSVSEMPIGSAAMKAFIGNTQMGYKIALCERDIAIFISLTLFCIVFLLLRGHVCQLHWTLWLILGVLPMGLDGFSQLLGGMFPQIFVLRESTPFLRTLTGAMFGVFTAWFLFPMLEKSFKEHD